MNTTAPLPPTPTASRSNSESAVCVHLGVQECDPWQVCYPAGQWLSLAIFERMLSHALAQAGLTAAAAGRAGDMARDAILLFNTSEPLPAVRCIVNELKEVGLAAFAEVAWLDLAEGIWRTAWPLAPTAPFDRWMEPAAMERRELLWHSFIRQIAEAVNPGGART